MKIRLALLASLLACGPRTAAAFSVYGKDNRKEIHEVPAAGIRELSRSVVALFKSAEISVDGDQAKLPTTTLLDQAPFHPSAPFAEQPAGAHCTGALVAPDRVLTSGHCFRTTPCEKTAFVFDYAIREAGQDPTGVPRSSLYGCKALLIHRDTGEQDWALIQLTRPVKDRAPLELDASDDLQAGDAVFTIGHPFGLPAKYAGSAKVRERVTIGFSSDLDAFGGNSGGPVFHYRTRKIVGLVSRGDPFLDHDPAHPGLVTIRVLARDAGAGTIFMDSQRIAEGVATLSRRALIGDGEAKRIQARLESLVRDLP